MSMNGLERIKPKRLRGSERFTSRSRALDLTVLDFRVWSASDLLLNTTRGILAEFIAAQAIGAELKGVRNGWAAVDITLPDGTTVEVKSSSYIQSWRQKVPSRIRFGIARTRTWDADAGVYTGEIKPQADL